MTDTDNDQSIIIDIGSYQTKAGLAGVDAPRSIIDYDETSLLCPVEKGDISNFEYMEKLMHYIYDTELKLDPTKYAVILAEYALTSKSNRETITKMMFETFTVPRYYTNIMGVLSLYASGRTTGLTIDCGHEVTQFVPIYEGYATPYCMQKVSIGGKHINEALQTLLKQKYSQININKKDIINIKHKYGYIAEENAEIETLKPKCNEPSWLVSGYLRDINSNYAKICAMDVEKQCFNYMGSNEINKRVRNIQMYKLPDGTVLNLDDELFECTEVLFNGKKDNFKIHHSLLQDCIMKIGDVHSQWDSLANIVLSGGNSMFNGFETRFTKECKNIASGSYARMFKAVFSPGRKYSAWIGGSILASLSTFEAMWITSTEYNESGPQIVHRKCF
eukprot:303818_1